ncbi:MAG TPA: hypothetical protein VLR50_08005 [Desulfobacterales bacterium]|nr:hypothetical protein [Desulfobacterales bacterium]
MSVIRPAYKEIQLRGLFALEREKMDGFQRWREMGILEKSGN